MALKQNQPALQVKKGNDWEYVFCHNTQNIVHGPIITTQNRRKALNAKQDLEYFQKRFANHEFRSDLA